MKFRTFLIVFALMILFILVLCLIVMKERKKMMAFLENVPQEVKDRLQNGEPRAVPTNSNAWVQEALIYNITVNKKEADIKAVYFSRWNNRNKFDYADILTTPAEVTKRDLKINDIVDIQLNTENQPVKIV